MVSLFMCKWCKTGFPGSKVTTVTTAGGSTYWVCNPCIKIGAAAARTAAEKVKKAKKEQEAQT